MSRRSKIIVGIQVLCFVWAFPLIAQLQFSTDKSSALYQVGETVNFQVRATEAGFYKYKIYYDPRVPALESGTISLEANQVHHIPYRATKAGVVLCSVVGPEGTAVEAAAFSPFEISPLEKAPNDFDQYWKQQKTLVNELGSSLRLALHKYNSHSTTYTFSLPNLDGRKVSGYMTLPSGKGPYPAAIIFPAFGTSPASVAVEESIAENAGLITISLSIHNSPVTEQAPTAYQPNNPTKRDEIYYRYALTGAISVINYLYTRPDFDQQNICAMGMEQGGGLATLLAGIDDRVNLLVTSNAAMNEHQGNKHQKASGFPYYLNEMLQRNQGTATYNATATAIKYYDAVYASQQFKGSSYTIIGLENEVIPAATTLASYNQLNGEKMLLLSTNGGQGHPDEYWNGRYDFFRRHFNSTPPVYNTATTKGYQIDAGKPQQIATNKALSLKATVQLENRTLTNLTGQWTKVSGPGTITFSNAKSASSTATFNKEGKYLLRYQAQDNRKLNEEGKIYFLSDDILITVSKNSADNSVSSLSLNCPANQTVEMESTKRTVKVNWSSPQASSTCPNSAIATTQISGPPNGSAFSTGRTRIQYEAADACNNRTTCSFTITVNQAASNNNTPNNDNETVESPTTSNNNTSCLIQPKTIKVSNGKKVGGNLNSLINGKGLSAEVLDAVHNTGNLYSGVWLSKGTTPTFTLDLGAIQPVDGIVLWNYAYHHWQVLKRRGIKDFSIATSTNGTNYSAEEQFTAIITTKSGKAEKAQHFAFSSTKSARYIRLRIINAQNDASYVGLGEIRLTKNCGQRGITAPSTSRFNHSSQNNIAVNKWTLSPNPSNGLLFLSIPSSTSPPLEIAIFNELGKQVHHQKNVQQSTTLTLQHLPRGLYFVKIQGADASYQLEKVIIQ